MAFPLCPHFLYLEGHQSYWVRQESPHRHLAEVVSMPVNVGGPCSYQYGAGTVLSFREAAEEQSVTWPRASNSEDLSRVCLPAQPLSPWEAGRSREVLGAGAGSQVGPTDGRFWFVHFLH